MSFTAGYTVNANTDFAFTVSNETISEMVQSENGITENDIAAYCYSALIDSRISSVFIQSSKNVYAAGFDSWQAENMPYYFIRDTRYINSNTDINKNDVVYERNFLVWNGTIYPNTPQSKAGTFLIMDIHDIKKWYVDYNAGMFFAENFASAITENGNTTPFNGYSGQGYTYLSNTIASPVILPDTDDEQENPESNIHVVNALVINNNIWIGHLNPSSHGDSNTGIIQSTYNQYVDSYVKGYLESGNPVIYQAGADKWSGIAKIKDMDYPDLGQRTTVYKSYVETENGVLMEINGNSGTTFDVRTDSGSHCKDLDTLLKWLSWAGLKFNFNGVDYKPIIEQGVITGYTDDMTYMSEFDEMTNVTGNNISPVPPAPAPSDKHDNEIDMDLKHLSSLNGFVKYYVMGISTADDLADALNRFDITLIGKDLLPNLISYKMFAIPSSAFQTGATRTITIAGHEMKRGDDSSIQAPIVTDITPITLDSIKIEPVYNDFRDFEPYTKIEMYVPFCGWFSLPSWCMGRTISGKMFIDLPNGSVKAVIKASKTVIAEVGGSCAVDVPFVAQSVGSKAAAIISNMTAGAVSMVTQNPQSIMSSTLGIATAFNANYTQIKGVMGDGSNIQGLDTVYIKVTRPAPTDGNKGLISNRYKHEKGIPCGKTLTLASGDGFTQIMDANINGTMTDREKQMIIDGFRHGLIL